MPAKIALYARVGYVEVERLEEDGFRRVFMRKALQPEVGSTSASGISLVPVASIAHKWQAQALISEYLHWVAAVAQENYGLRFDVAAMAASDIEDAAKFYPPAGRFYLVMHQGLAVVVLDDAPV